ncbi:SDR family NAD(P)-dependent oxidoreductase [Rhodopirellula sp. MGV]|uniref:SDR family NAD(P)-dependent oxidoreductase n=1 Tax=Rhodopirellula sp. MGV TaxID=2023130 RepID=UPI000B96F065|nr:SDR family oxidoreductase [Rhodopirellula sp. MGV]OYP35079.1 oxidoreductase [Rhodopirellula sp. MGV]PNY38083.1 SDR family NAD(P)-dependent oxidoreductase [Rhodopirellula baltica]
MDLKLSQHTALITGGASGIGLASAKQFAQEGCNLLLWDRSPDIEQVASNLRQTGVTVETSVVDIVDFESLKNAIDEFTTRGGTVQHVVHCAAMGSGKFGFPFTELEPADWRKTLEVNIMGMVNVAHALTPYLTKQQYGTFVFLASIAGQIGSQTDPPYSASKAANINFAQCMAKDLASHQVRVNTVCPGMVKTPLNRSVWQAWHDRTPVEQRQSYEDWAEHKIKSLVPLGKWQSCEDIADMIVFLSSDRSQQVTGQTINVDGGFVMHW